MSIAARQTRLQASARLATSSGQLAGPRAPTQAKATASPARTRGVGGAAGLASRPVKAAASQPAGTAARTRRAARIRTVGTDVLTLRVGAIVSCRRGIVPNCDV